MRHYRNIFVIPVVALCFFAGHFTVPCAGETLSGNSVADCPESSDETGDESVSGNEMPEESGHEGTVSENTVSENTVSGNIVSENTVSGNTAVEEKERENTVSQDELPVKEVSSVSIRLDEVVREERGAKIRIIVESRVSKIVRVEAENAAVGIRKKLYGSSGEPSEANLTLSLRAGVNGRYLFHALDSEGNKADLEVSAGDIKRRSFSGYTEQAKQNAAGSSVARSAVYSNKGKTALKTASSGRNYSIKSGGGKGSDSTTVSGNYSKWSLLNKKDKNNNKDEEKIWREPDEGYDGYEGGRIMDVTSKPESSDSLPGLSDYGI